MKCKHGELLYSLKKFYLHVEQLDPSFIQNHVKMWNMLAWKCWKYLSKITTITGLRKCWEIQATHWGI